MTPREIIFASCRHTGADRIGFDFLSGTDFYWIGQQPLPNPDEAYARWGDYPELRTHTPGFRGELRRENGNILGRLSFRTKGECLYAALEEGWEGYESYRETYLVPHMDPSRVKYSAPEPTDRFVCAGVSALQAPIRDTRRIDNMLADTLLEPEMLSQFIGDCCTVACTQAEAAADAGANGIFICDDWGMQNTLYINPASFRKLWKPAYARLAETAHRRGMLFLMHSCGQITEAVPDLLECGVDAFQFDQPSIYDFEWLSSQLKGKAALFAPVDIQQILPTGNREIIEAEARRMLRYFKMSGGGLIAKDYPTYGDIGVEPEWAKWAEDIFRSEGIY